MVPAPPIGIPYGRGIQAAIEYKGEVNGEKIKLIQLDDGSDPSAATRAARKLIEEEKVDLLIGTATAPSTIAMMAVATELKVPMIAVSPVTGQPNPADQWGVSVPQPASLLVKVVADRMKRDAMKNIGYIGFSDAWGDLVYNGAKAAEAGRRHQGADQRALCARRYLGHRPDPQGSRGASRRGAHRRFRHAGARCRCWRSASAASRARPTAPSRWSIPISCASAASLPRESRSPPVRSSWPISFPDDHFAKKLALEFRAAFQKANNAPTTDVFSAYSFDGWMIFTSAAARALKAAKPGTVEFRKALAPTRS